MRRSGALTVGVLALASAIACGSPSTGPPSAATASPAPTAGPTTGTAAAPTATVVPRPTVTVGPRPTVAPTTTAERALVGFVDAARAADARLRRAADLVNGSIRADTVVVDEHTAAAVRAADPASVAAALPAGLPPRLMLPVLTTYSDLVSRSAALAHFRVAQTFPRVPPAGQDDATDENQYALQCLANGAPAAHRFQRDLAAVVMTAGSTPPPTAGGPTSRASAELAVRVEDIDSHNRGCDACGGFVATRLGPIAWDTYPAGATRRTGYLDDQLGERIRFTATYGPRGWSVVMSAC